MGKKDLAKAKTAPDRRDAESRLKSAEVALSKARLNYINTKNHLEKTKKPSIKEGFVEMLVRLKAYYEYHMQAVNNVIKEVEEIDVELYDVIDETSPRGSVPSMGAQTV